MDWLIDFLLHFYGPTPYLLVLGILLACGLGVPIPEDITLFAGGLLAYYGVADVWIMIAVALFGVMAGDSLVYWMGARFGRRLVRRGWFARVLPEERLLRVQGLFQTRGNKLLFAARFMPGLRAPIFFSAGILHMPYRVLLAYDGSAALLSVPAIVGAVYYFGDQIDRVVRIIQKIEGGILAVIVAVLAAFALRWYVQRKRSANTAK